MHHCTRHKKGCRIEDVLSACIYAPLGCRSAPLSPGHVPTVHPRRFSAPEPRRLSNRLWGYSVKHASSIRVSHHTDSVMRKETFVELVLQDAVAAAAMPIDCRRVPLSSAGSGNPLAIKIGRNLAGRLSASVLGIDSEYDGSFFLFHTTFAAYQVSFFA